jgi:hypothetical protein
MYSQKEMPKENKINLVANSIVQKKSNGMQGFCLLDNRPEAVVQRGQKNLANKANAPIQLNGRKRTFSEAFGEDHTSEYEPLRKRRIITATRTQHGTAESRIERMHQRGEARRKRDRIPKGRYQTPTGMTTVSGLFGQRMTQSRKDDYGGETFGSVPPYAKLQANLPNNTLSSLSDTKAAVPDGLSDRQRLATSLVFTLAHGSEEDRAPGTSAYFRAMVRDYVSTGQQGEHPLSSTLFPARSTAQEQRNLMEGRISLNNQQRRALEEDPEPSSDEEDDYFIKRK